MEDVRHSRSFASDLTHGGVGVGLALPRSSILRIITLESG